METLALLAALVSLDCREPLGLLARRASPARMGPLALKVPQAPWVSQASGVLLVCPASVVRGASPASLAHLASLVSKGPLGHLENEGPLALMAHLACLAHLASRDVMEILALMGLPAVMGLLDRRVSVERMARQDSQVHPVPQEPPDQLGLPARTARGESRVLKAQ